LSIREKAEKAEGWILVNPGESHPEQRGHGSWGNPCLSKGLTSIHPLQGVSLIWMSYRLLTYYQACGKFMEIFLIEIYIKVVNMFAVIKTGGKQYKVQEGEILQVEKLNIEKGKKFKFEEVLLIEDGDKTQIGTPFVKNAVVEALVVENFKDKKVIVFKKKRRKQYRKTRGHRQELTKIKIEGIVFAGKQAPEKAAPKKKAAAKKTIKPAKKTIANKPAAKKTSGSSEKAKRPAKKATPAKTKTAAKTPAKKKVVTKTKKTTPVKE